MTRGAKLQALAWGLTAAVCTVSIIAWGSLYAWDFSRISSYYLFPLFGLLAFGLMWVHYIMSAVRQYYGLPKRALTQYFELTSAAVLALILMHPGLLVWQLWQDGFGLPPGSYRTYVGSALYGSVVLGFIALIIFVLYEFRRAFSSAKWWRLLQYASDGAMLLILVHGLRLGAVIDSGWFRWVWFFYGATFLVSLIYTRMNPQASLSPYCKN